MKATRTGNKMPSDPTPVIRQPQSLTLSELFVVLRKKAEWLRGVGDGLDNVRILQEGVSISHTLNTFEKDHPELFGDNDAAVYS